MNKKLGHDLCLTGTKMVLSHYLKHKLQKTNIISSKNQDFEHIIKKRFIFGTMVCIQLQEHKKCGLFLFEGGQKRKQKNVHLVR